MKKIIVIAFMLVSYISFSQKNFSSNAQVKIDANFINGSWKVQSILNEGGFYYNLEKDSLVLISKTLSKSTQLEANEKSKFVSQTKEDFGQIKYLIYQFNKDNTCSIIDENTMKKQNGTFVIDEKNGRLIIKIEKANNQVETIDQAIVSLKDNKLTLKIELGETKMSFDYVKIK